MYKRVIAVVALIILILVGAGVWRVYRIYENREAARKAALQQRAEEVSVTMIEGWTVDEVAEAMEKAGLISQKDFLRAAEKFDYQSYPLINKPAKTDLEGYLFPDTYRFAKDSSAETILDKILNNFTNRLNTLGVTAAKDSFIIPGYENITVPGGDGKPGMSLYDIITLASIIEKESGGKGSTTGNLSLQEERGLVAGVFYNRLAIGQALESDATINYITGKNNPAPSAQDLSANSPYNTYKYPGLPPGPICNPSLGSIRAALQPTKSDYYYFLHKQPSGKVDFSKTFEEHVREKTGQ